MKSKTKKLLIAGGTMTVGGFIALFAISTGTNLLGFLLTQCKEIDTVVLEESVDTKGVITKKLSKKCVNDTVDPKLETEKAELIVEKRNDYLKASEQKEKTSNEILKLENETEILEVLSKEEPNLISNFTATVSQLEQAKTKFQFLEGQVEDARAEFTRVLDGIQIVVPQEEQKELVFSQVELLNTPTVELDQKIYTWTDRVYITIIDPLANKNVDEIDIIGTQNERKIRITTDGGRELRYIMRETGFDTGIFTGEITLTGIPGIDANNDGKDDTSGGSSTFGGPTDGLLSVEPSDGISVSYEYDECCITVGSALVRWNIGEVYFLKSKYQLNETAFVRIIDPDLNVNPFNIDFVKIIVSSESDHKGIGVLLQETNEATGMFEASISFTKEKSGQNILKTSFGESVTAIYVDKTLPEPYFISDQLELIGNATIKETLMPG